MSGIPLSMPREPIPQGPTTEQKALHGLNYRIGEIDHTISALRDTIKSKSMLYQLGSKVSLTYASRTIQALQKEKGQIEKMRTHIEGTSPSAPKVKLYYSLGEIQEAISEKTGEACQLKADIASVNGEKEALSKEYHDAVVFESVAESGFSKGTKHDTATIKKMDLLTAKLKGLEHSLNRVNQELSRLEIDERLFSRDITIHERLIQEQAKPIQEKLSSIQQGLAKKKAQIQGAFFLAKFPLEKELRTLRRQEKAAFAELEPVKLMQMQLTKRRLQEERKQTTDPARLLLINKILQESDPGRISLLNEMLTYPEQTGKDINRLGKLRFGDEKFNESLFTNNQPQENLQLVTKAFKTYMSKQRPNETFSDDQALEILSLTMQNYFVPIAGYDAPLILAEFASPQGKDYQTASFAYDSPEVVINRTCKKEYMYIGQDTNLQDEKRSFLMEVEFRYNLDTKEVTYQYRYTMDGIKTTLPLTQVPFS